MREGGGIRLEGVFNPSLDVHAVEAESHPAKAA